MAGVIQGLLLKFNLYLFTRFNGACSSRIDFMLSKNELMERFTSLLIELENIRPIFIKIVKNKVLLNKCRAVSFINI